MNNKEFVKNNKYIKNVINLTDNFLVIKSRINKVIIILTDLKSLLFLLL